MVLTYNLGEPFNFCAILDDYDVQHQIGEGGFGTVKLATHKETRKKYAVKFMDISSARKSPFPQTLNPAMLTPHSALTDPSTILYS